MNVTSAIDIIEEKLDDSGNKFYTVAEIEQVLYQCEIEIVAKAKAIITSTKKVNSLLSHKHVLTGDFISTYADGENLEPANFDQIDQMYIENGSNLLKIPERSIKNICDDNGYGDFYVQLPNDSPTGAKFFLKRLTQSYDSVDYAYIIGMYSETKADLTAYTTTILSNQYIMLAINYAIALLRSKNKENGIEIGQAIEEIDKFLGTFV